MHCTYQHVVILYVLFWHFLCCENNIADMLIEDTRHLPLAKGSVFLVNVALSENLDRLFQILLLISILEEKTFLSRCEDDPLENIYKTIRNY